MDLPEPPALRFLVEWYDSGLVGAAAGDIAARLEGGAATVSAASSPVQVLVTVAAPADEVLYSVFAAYSVETVLLACRQAGLPPDRIIGDVHAHVSRSG